MRGNGADARDRPVIEMVEERRGAVVSWAATRMAASSGVRRFRAYNEADRTICKLLVTNAAFVEYAMSIEKHLAIRYRSRKISAD